MPEGLTNAGGVLGRIKSVLSKAFNIVPLGGTTGGAKIVTLTNQTGVVGFSVVASNGQVVFSVTDNPTVTISKAVDGTILAAFSLSISDLHTPTRFGVNSTATLDSSVANVLRVQQNWNDTTLAWISRAGPSRVVTSDFTESAAALTAIPGLSATLIAGRAYIGRLVLKAVDSTAADGIKIDFNGGTATATTFWCGILLAGGGLTDTIGVDTSTALATAVTATTITGEQIIEVPFFMLCNGAGTFIPRAAQNSHSTGTLTVRVGSHMMLEDTP